MLPIDCDAPMTKRQTTKKITTSDAPQSSPQTPVSEKSTTHSSNIDTTTTVATEKSTTNSSNIDTTTNVTTEKSTTNSSNIDTTTTVTTTNVKHQSITTTTDTTTGKSLVITALSHDMLKLKIPIHEILINNFRLEFPKLNKCIVNIKGANLLKNCMYIVQTVVRFLNQGQLQLSVGGLMSYLRYLRLFAYSCIQHNVLCCLLCSCSSGVLCAQCCQFLWIVYS